jgi:peptidoglycan hydrolase-like protein with peptidoglycan-binding domain
MPYGKKSILIVFAPRLRDFLQNGPLLSRREHLEEIMRIERNTIIQQPVVDKTDAKVSKEDQAKSENASADPKFTSGNLAVAADALGTSSSRASILRNFLEGQLKPPTDSPKPEPTVGMPDPNRSSNVGMPDPNRSSNVGMPDPNRSSAIGASNTVLKPGDNNDQVTELQYDLNRWRNENGLPSISVNGDYNAETEQAVRDFQKATGLKEDGLAGPNVQGRLALEKNKDFEQLDPEVKDLIRYDYSQLQNDPEKRDNLVKLATNREFANMISKDSQEAALSAFIQGSGDKKNLQKVENAITDVAILEKKNTLSHLPQDTQREVISTMFYETTARKVAYYDNPAVARDGILRLATDPEFAKLSQSDQSKLLEGIRGNNDQGCIDLMRGILKSPGYKNMDDGMKSRVIQLANENALYENRYPNASPNVQDSTRGLFGMDLLLNDPNFINLPPEQQSSQLNAFKTVPPDSDLVY